MRAIGVEKLLITGGTGRVGQWVVRELATDYEIIIASLDPTPATPTEGAHYSRVDLSDPKSLNPLMRDVDAVVHLAAIPSPVKHTAEEVFSNNINSTFNVVEAAVRNGIKKIVYSGSGSSLGFAFSERPMIPDYMPMDENHPLRPQDAYGLSKWLGEEILEAASRRTGMTTISLRPTTVIVPDDYDALVPALLKKTGGIGIFAYVDARDYASAVRLALEARGIVHDRFFITADDALCEEPIATVFPKRFPGSEQVASHLRNFESPVSSAKAKRELGYRPKYRWRELVAATYWKSESVI